MKQPGSFSRQHGSRTLTKYFMGFGLMSLITSVLEAANRYVFGDTIQELRADSKVFAHALGKTQEALNLFREYNAQLQEDAEYYRDLYEGTDLMLSLNNELLHEQAERLAIIEGVANGSDIEFYTYDDLGEPEVETQKLLEAFSEVADEVHTL